MQYKRFVVFITVLAKFEKLKQTFCNSVFTQLSDVLVPGLSVLTVAEGRSELFR